MTLVCYFPLICLGVSTFVPLLLGVIRLLVFLCRAFPASTPVRAKKLLFLSLVLPKLTYCSPIWRPNLIKDILLLESVQERATKFILNYYSSDYKTRLTSLELLLLMYCLELNDIMFLSHLLKTPPHILIS